MIALFSSETTLKILNVVLMIMTNGGENAEAAIGCLL